ncbi:MULTISPECIES: type II toxin-antitoxin system VapB family antitoxin [unclassified Treponema]|uniref:type II toxin-antitoxin system VapB family antitoxin n=1 Tax=unclassified Treponema TaxID=2638727 RepID=UPI0020A31987|nr:MULTISPECIES: type II toxin-antitoxin system VapB family antitoxin [unclassified Treponema]UTC66746.1 type II toxin-antitoxin system VapB family antitoxin [Treponema sp. OMZ 789]UTC69478.1 type II toxin-antitoxin system VapB family antitoxin [Treponema sp. OMZ 790]UTC72192.1 type II toxin-antitoxin system VapB family antitoxin [Treponema sp. OMZ 791]
MRTTIVLNDSKIQKAFVLTKIKTKTELIEVALDNLIKKYQIQDLKNYFGKCSLDIDLDNLRIKRWKYF